MPASPETEIKRLINKKGKITFEQFMNVALYHPQGGYYTKSSVFADSGDYYTSAAAHPAFGSLIALHLSRIWEIMERPSRFYAVELGAGSGQLARDVIEYSAKLGSEFHESLLYIAIDRYGVKLPLYRNLVQPIISDGIPLRAIVGCVISNELVDSFPFHRFRIDDGEVREVYVGLDSNGSFIELLGKPSTPRISQRLNSLGLSLPDGYNGEVNLKIRPWLEHLSNALERGFVITIDYGYEARDLYSLDRPQGTFDTFYRHTRGASPYQRIGRQDITAHVDFSLLMSEGDDVGLNTIGFMTQAEYLARLGFAEMRDMLRNNGLGHRELRANMMGMLELVKPEGFGGFKVLLQERGTGIADAANIFDVGGVPDVALLRQDNTPLMEGRYPHQTWEVENIWPFESNDSEPS